MLMDLSCPIELVSYDITHDDVGNTRAYLLLSNLARRRVLGFDAVIRWKDHAAGTHLDMPYSAQPKDGSARFHLPASTSDMPGADGLEIIFHQVRLEGEAPWDADPARLIDWEAPKEPSGVALDRLQQAAGDDAVCFPQEDEHYWTCVCGRLNEQGQAKCARCVRSKRMVFQKYRREALLSRSARRKKRTVWRFHPTPLSVVLLCALAGGLIFLLLWTLL